MSYDGKSQHSITKDFSRDEPNERHCVERRALGALSLGERVWVFIYICSGGRLPGGEHFLRSLSWILPQECPLQVSEENEGRLHEKEVCALIQNGCAVVEVELQVKAHMSDRRGAQCLLMLESDSDVTYRVPVVRLCCDIVLQNMVHTLIKNPCARSATAGMKKRFVALSEGILKTDQSEKLPSGVATVLTLDNELRPKVDAVAKAIELCTNVENLEDEDALVATRPRIDSLDHLVKMVEDFPKHQPGPADLPPPASSATHRESESAPYNDETQTDPSIRRMSAITKVFTQAHLDNIASETDPAKSTACCQIVLRYVERNLLTYIPDNTEDDAARIRLDDILRDLFVTDDESIALAEIYLICRDLSEYLEL